MRPPRRSGETGRRTGFKIPRPQGHEGSIPSSGTGSEARRGRRSKPRPAVTMRCARPFHRPMGGGSETALGTRPHAPTAEFRVRSHANGTRCPSGATPCPQRDIFDRRRVGSVGAAAPAAVIGASRQAVAHNLCLRRPDGATPRVCEKGSGGCRRAKRLRGEADRGDCRIRPRRRPPGVLRRAPLSAWIPASPAGLLGSRPFSWPGRRPRRPDVSGCRILSARDPGLRPRRRPRRSGPRPLSGRRSHVTKRPFRRPR